MATFDGGAGSDTFAGGTENDSITGFGGADSLSGGTGNDLLRGDYFPAAATDGDDTLDGGDGADVLIGGQGNDRLTAGAGDDQLVTGVASGGFFNGLANVGSYYPGVDGGNDTLDGGEGVDRAYVMLSGHAGGVTVDISDAAAVSLIREGGVVIGSITGVEQVFAFGGSGADSLVGGTLGDFLYGDGGDNTLRGGGGSDYLRVGAGNDVVQGGDGQDGLEIREATGPVTIDLRLTTAQDTGGAGVKLLSGVEGLYTGAETDLLIGNDQANYFGDGYGGDDTFIGGLGGDSLTVSRYGGGPDAVVLRGGADNDYLAFSAYDGAGTGGKYADRVTLDGGTGVDTIYLVGAQAATVIGGDGDDRVFVDVSGGDARITLGAGVDTLGVNWIGSAPVLGPGARVVTDFATGAGGDKLDFESWLTYFATGYAAGQNPFLTGHLRLRQDGADVKLQGDADGGGNAFTTMFIFRGATVSAFTPENLQGFGFPIVGSSGADSLTGGPGAELLDGLGGADRLEGRDGDDTLVGGLGADTLLGGRGDDVADFSEATVNLNINLALGTASGLGADVLQGVEDVVGGAGNDRITAAALEAYAGGDIRKGAARQNVDFASAVALGPAFSLANDADIERSTDIPHATANATVNGGAAAEFYLFTARAGFEVLVDIDQASFNSALEIYDAAGVLVTSQDNNTDDPGSTGGLDPRLAFTPTADGIYYVKVTGAFGSPPPAGGTYVLHVSDSGRLRGSDLAGLAGDDRLTGAAGADTLNGGLGHDALNGGARNDRLLGAEGNDSLLGGDGDDELVGDQGFYMTSFGFGDDNLSGGLGSDFLSGGRGFNTLLGGEGDDLIHAGEGRGVRFNGQWYSSSDSSQQVGVNIINGGAGFDQALFDLFVETAGMVVDISRPGQVFAITRGGLDFGSITGVEQTTIHGGLGNDRFTGGTANDVLEGRAGDDTLIGGAGDDVLYGATGNDVMNGGAGVDSTYFFGAPSGVTVDLRLTAAQDTGGAGVDRYISMEQLTGSSFADRFTGTDAANRFADDAGGSDSFFGGGGDDYLSIFRSSSSAAAAVELDGGIGADTLYVFSYNAAGGAKLTDSATVTGGGDADILYIVGTAAATLDAGAGADNLYVDFRAGLWDIRLGADDDSLILLGFTGGGVLSAPALVRDFEAGDAGDRLELTGWLSSTLQGYVGGSNPFASGHLDLRRAGDDVLLRLDVDGGGDAFSPFIRFRNAAVADFTAFNFDGFDPDPAPMRAPRPAETWHQTGIALEGHADHATPGMDAPWHFLV
jgi:Ca2+-binding RTX toxin-like protein